MTASTRLRALCGSSGLPEEHRHQNIGTRLIPGAQLGWVRPYEGTEFSAVAYVKQWTNPRPQVEIQSIDVLGGPDRNGTPAVLAITAAQGE
jgi:hypothetical protein